MELWKQFKGVLIANWAMAVGFAIVMVLPYDPKDMEPIVDGMALALYLPLLPVTMFMIWRDSR